MLSVLRVSKSVCQSQAVTSQLSHFVQKPHNNVASQLIRTFGRDSRGGFQTVKQGIGQQAKRKTLKETLLSPATDTPFAIGRGAVAGGALFGIGALCYYGIGLSNEPGAFERSHAWPQYVRDRIHTTYQYFGASLGMTAVTAIAVFRSPTMLRLMTRNSFTSILLTMGAMIGTGMIAQSIPYQEGFGIKQIAWLVHCGVLGAVIAPMCMVGGPIMLRAAYYTAGIVGGLSAVAACAPSEKFLNMGGPLAIGLGFVFVSSLGSLFLPPTTALGAGLYSISLYGGLLLFSGLLLYDTQRVIKRAEMHPQYAPYPFDPVNASISLYLDAINIFIRMVVILAGGGSRRR